MKRKKSSHRWLQEHFNDIYVQKAQKEGYRSRAVYKLKEMNEHDRLIVPGMTVIDLGAAPGGWTQYLVEMLRHTGRIIALDCLPMDPIEGVDFILGDFQEEAVLAALHSALGQRKVDFIFSDMAPNMSGNAAIDIPRAMNLCELALDLVHEVLATEGGLLMKVFHGSGFDGLIRTIKKEFQQVSIRKPLASRSRSRETYVLAKGYRL